MSTTEVPRVRHRHRHVGPARRVAPARKHRGAGRVVLSAITTIVIAAAGAAVVLTAVVPALVGAKALTVLSGSMTPALAVGDVVVVRPVAPEELRAGDIVTFQPRSGDPTLVTHRIVSLREHPQRGVMLVTRGDANGADDSEIVAAQVMGRVIYHVPSVGWVGIAVGSLRGIVVVAVAALLIVGGGLVVCRPSIGITRGRSRA
jgi:signal peptidase